MTTPKRPSVAWFVGMVIGFVVVSALLVLMGVESWTAATMTLLVEIGVLVLFRPSER